MTSKIALENVAIVLVQPQIPENIGSVARAMHNMGLSRLIVVDPKNCDADRMNKTATGSSTKVLEGMDIHKDLREALATFQYLVGTTARNGTLRPALTQPRTLAQKLIPISQDNSAAILFGPEDRGLSNDQLRFCHTIVTVPTASFSSLNLAQAVVIVCYELFLATDSDRRETPVPRLANSFELEGMYDHLREMLSKIGFLDPQNPEHWLLNIRRFLARVPLRAREVRIIRGICRQMDWYASQVDTLQKEKENP
ncbi:MAG: RNA methyltransferase [Deltaproteobacteria bacterium]|nr:RNA methyltransferase [Deltaproteobacteria bacterium]